MFVTLPVRDVARSKAFYEALGFALDPTLSSDAGASFVINERTRVMLVSEAVFTSLTTRAIGDRATHLQALFALSCESRADVDALVRLALANGGTTEDQPTDHGFMYDWSFFDPDGHGWGVACMTASDATG
jgi:predicted lactoylglutathione lyase